MTRPTRSVSYRQRLIPALERSRRIEWWSRLAMILLTTAGLAGMLGGTSMGRYAVASFALRIKGAARRAMGMGPSRSEIDTAWRLKRARGIERTARTYRAFFEKEASPQWRRILSAASMAPDDVLLRWANYDWTVVLSPRVFEADDTGRAYRMRPNTRAFWTRNHSLPHGLSSFFFLPDTREVRQALADAGEDILPESFQTTNSWGCRGPEPDLKATVRGLVIGDSFMQGLFVHDDQTPPECLRRRLQDAWKVPVSVLNTGHVGYSPEQYDQTLREYFDRFRPQFVVVSVCPNDFGNAADVLSGRGDWDEGKFWLNEIEQFCRSKRVPCLLSPVPVESQVVGRWRAGNYQGQVSNLSDMSGLFHVNPIAAFTEEHLRRMRAATRQGKRYIICPLFNGHLGDGHFSAEGSALWAEVLARRIVLLVDPPKDH